MSHHTRTPDIATLKVGDYAIFKKTVSPTDVMIYAGASGDFSPLCMDTTIANHFGHRTNLVHPMLLFSMAGGAIHRLLPEGSRTISRSFEQLQHVYASDTVSIVATIESIDHKKNEITIVIQCFLPDESLALKGLAVESLSVSKENLA